MPRHLVAVCLAVAAAAAAPVPKGIKKPEPFPHAVGTRWEYIRNGNENTVWVEEVTASEEKGGVRTVRVDITTNTGAKRFETYELKDGEVRLTASTGGEYDPPLLIRRAGLKDGDGWQNKYTLNGGESTVECTVGKAEEVSTPAGKFTAHPITRKYASGLEATYWYADGVGLVRQTANGRPGQELKAYTPGR